MIQEAEKIAVIITGYTKASPKKVAEKLRIALEQKRYRVVVVDPFEQERKKFVFRKTLLTCSSSKDMTTSVNEAFVKEGLLLKKVDVAFCYSYGAIPGMFQNNIFVRRYAFLSPALGKGTVKWGFKEKFFSFLPGLEEMNDEEFQKKIFERLTFLQTIAEVRFFLPYNDQTDLYEDERVWYPRAILREHESIFVQKDFIPVKMHRDMIRSPDCIKTILEKMGI